MRSIESFIDQMQDDTDNWFPEASRDVTLLVLGLAGEAGEVCDLIKKWKRGSKPWQEIQGPLEEELIDVFHYWCLLIGLLKIDVDEVYRVKREYNVSRYE